MNPDFCTKIDNSDIMHPEPSNSNTVIEVLIPDTLYTQHSNRIPECEVKLKLQKGAEIE
jgi:hypothetical protein